MITKIIMINKIIMMQNHHDHLLTEICRTTGWLPSASCQPTATLLMSGTTVRLVDNVVFDKEGEESEATATTSDDSTEKSAETVLEEYIDKDLGAVIEEQKEKINELTSEIK